MKKNLTYLIFVVDRSGSMSSIAKDMIGGFNAFIKAQRDARLGECKVFFYQFDTKYDAVYEGVAIENVIDLTGKTYVPRGGTALYCSLGKTIVSVGEKLNLMPESERPEKVLVVTITDGEDNSVLENSEEKVYTLEQVKEMVKQQTDMYNWDFAYIGANQDAWKVGNSMGYAKGTSLNYVASSTGTAAMFDKLTRGTISYRACAGAKFAFDDKDNKTVAP